MAAAFQEVGVAAASVDGSMSVKKRDRVLADYAEGQLTMLCACDILSEGWDSPLTEVLLMARPTLSKIVYVQQLGRGTRKAEGKDCLLVFDFIDNTVRHAQALSVHGLLKKGEYRPGALVAAPDRVASDSARTSRVRWLPRQTLCSKRRILRLRRERPR